MHKDILKEIHHECYPIIKDKYSQYINKFDSRKPLYRGVFLIPKKFCILFFKDLSKGFRGKTPRLTGNIYIRKEAFTKHLLVHESLHRLSTNLKKAGPFRYQYVQGFNIDDEHYYYVGINELFTEWIAYSITGVKEQTIYQHYLYVIDELHKKAGSKVFDQFLLSYFNNDIAPIISYIDANNKLGAVAKLKELSTIIFSFDLNANFHLI